MRKPKFKVHVISKVFVSIILIIMFLIGLGVFNYVKVDAQSNENKVFCSATIDDDFDDSSVIVILQPSISKYNRIDNAISDKLLQNSNVLSMV